MSADVHCPACADIGRHIERLLLGSELAETLDGFVSRAIDSFELEDTEHTHYVSEQDDPLTAAKGWSEAEMREAFGR